MESLKQITDVKMEPTEKEGVALDALLSQAGLRVKSNQDLFAFLKDGPIVVGGLWYSAKPFDYTLVVHSDYRGRKFGKFLTDMIAHEAYSLVEAGVLTVDNLLPTFVSQKAEDIWLAVCKDIFTQEEYDVIYRILRNS